MTPKGNFLRDAERNQPDPQGLWVERLSLSNFRNIRQAELQCDARPVLLLGPNGAGKTNLLEALSLLTPGRGLRRARLNDIAPREKTNSGHSGTAAWAVAAEVQEPSGLRSLGTACDEEGASGRRVMQLDGARVSSQQALGEVLSAVWLTPEVCRILGEGPGGRRRFLDRLVFGFDPAHSGRINAYEQAMRERARLLKAGGADEVWLTALERTMAERSVAIASARRGTVERLAGACAQTSGLFPKAALGLRGEAELWLEEAPALQVEERLLAALKAGRWRDAEAGGSVVGAQRCDFVVEHLEREMPAELCSTGEQKALLISILLSHARLLELDRGRPPLILLDELVAHLDRERRQSLFDQLLGLKAQVWLSGNESEPFEPIIDAAQVFQLNGGAVLRSADP